MSARVIRLALAVLSSAASLVVFSGCSDSAPGVPPTPTQVPPSQTPTRTATKTVTSTPVPTPTPTPVPGVNLYRVSGHLVGIGSDRGVTLVPTGRTTFSIDTFFVFADVAPGEYTITVDDGCGEFPCFAHTPITVIDRDVSVDLTNDLCPPPLLSSSSGPPGTLVSARGRCYYFHSGASGNVFFDDVQVGTTSHGDTIGNFGAGFQIPLDAAVGAHTITFAAFLTPQSPGVSVPFVVTEGP